MASVVFRWIVVLTMVAKSSSNGVGSAVSQQSLVIKSTVPVQSSKKSKVAIEDDSGKLVEITRLRLTLRALHLSLVFLPVSASAILALLIPIFRRRVWYAMVRASLGRSGAAFVKWAQWSATRADLFPEALRSQLLALQSSAPAHKYSHTEAVVRRATGTSGPAEFFDSFDKKPVASGSIAQVHRGRLRGRDVAIKVRHPQVALELALDASLMEVAARALDLAVPWLKLADSISQFSSTLAGQAYLDTEASELKQFRRRFKGWKNVDFPEPIFASSALLVESFENGRIVNSLKLPVDPAVGAFLVNRGQDVYLKMLLVDRVMHADLHPGNLLWSKNRLVLVDAGMVAHLTESESEAFVGLIEALGAADAPAAARCIRLFSRSNENLSSARVAAFDADVAALFLDKCRGYGTHCDFGDVVRGVLELVRKHQVRVDANYATLIINALCLDGMAHDIYPAYSVLDGAKPLLAAHRKLCSTRGMNDKNPSKVGRFFFQRLFLPVGWRLKNVYDKAKLNSIKTA